MKKGTLSIFAALLLLASVCSCTGNGNHNTDNGEESGTGTADTTDAVTEKKEYVMPSINMKGEDVTVLNAEQFYGTYIDFVPKDDTDTLDAAIYESNMRIEEQFNFNLVEEEFPFAGGLVDTYRAMGDLMIKNFQAGDDVYDFVHYPVNQRMELLTRGYLMDLSELDGFHFDQPWWDVTLNDTINVNGHQYMACGSVNLMAYESMTTIFFNKAILAANNLDSPYEMVREGTWTLDAMIELARDAQNLNADPQWDVTESGTSVYGIARHESYPFHFFVSAGVRGITETNGEYRFTLENDDFYTAVEKIATVFTKAGDGGIAGGGAGAATGNGYLHYVTLFSNSRALFLMSELKAGVEMRASDVPFGMLPFPKLNEAQDQYYTNMIDSLHFICIPTLSENPDKVASIIDALAYDRYQNVVPVYYDSHVTHKGLRDEESLEMLEIMSAGRMLDIGLAYNWYGDFRDQLNSAVCSGGSTVSSMIAEHKDSIDITIEDFVEGYFE